MRPDALAFLRGSDEIIHAGDIGDPAILEELGKIAPVTAVRGNNDRGPWAKRIPHANALKVGNVSIYVLHDVKELDFAPAAAGHRVVVAGHSHKPLVKENDGVLYVNPGSAGPRRFTLPIAVGELKINGASVRARIKELA